MEHTPIDAGRELKVLEGLCLKVPGMRNMFGVNSFAGTELWQAHAASVFHQVNCQPFVGVKPLGRFAHFLTLPFAFFTHCNVYQPENVYECLFL